MNRFCTPSVLGMLCLLASASPIRAHVGDSFFCAAIVSASCEGDSLCLALFDDDKGVMPILFDRNVADVRPGHKAWIHKTVHKVTRVRPVARGFRYLEMVPDSDPGANLSSVTHPNT